MNTRVFGLRPPPPRPTSPVACNSQLVLLTSPGLASFPLLFILRYLYLDPLSSQSREHLFSRTFPAPSSAILWVLLTVFPNSFQADAHSSLSLLV